ncbi:MAG: IPT/TIG domain-containing protein [Chitinophagaceae bacterium]|jgi:hypothetical protein|nr:IPT/TIG domain-containing protein [Chitinophagaceae bacterium]
MLAKLKLQSPVCISRFLFAVFANRPCIRYFSTSKTFIAFGLLLAVALGACKKTVSTPKISTLTVRSISPTNGPYNTIVTIRGQKFDPIAGGTQVTLNGLPLEIQQASDSVLIVKIPRKAGKGPLIVKTKESEVVTDTFFYQPTVHVAGTISNNNINSAVYWKNGNPVVLGERANANTIAAKGEDVYVGGGMTVNNEGRAVIWKNGTPNLLESAGLKGATVVGMALTTDGWVAVGTGIDPVTLANRAIMWRNTTATILPGELQNTVATQVMVSGSDVHVVGYTNAGQQFGQYWINGSLTTIQQNPRPGEYTGIAMQGTDVIVSGTEQTDPVRETAVYWRNGVPVRLSSAPNTFSRASALAVWGSHVYVGGTLQDPNSTSILFWRNTTPNFLVTSSFSSPTPSSGFFLNALSVLANGDVFCAGIEFPGGFSTKAVLWINRQKTILPAITDQATAEDVLVE